MRDSLKKVFIVHGEAEVSEILVQKIRDELAIPAVVPRMNQEFILE
jgi:hypothetical protein